MYDIANFFIEPENFIFWGISFKLMKNLAALVPKKLQGFYETLLYHCYTVQPVCRWQNSSWISTTPVAVGWHSGDNGLRQTSTHLHVYQATRLVY